ncbi:MAG: hypothetical protein PHT51_00465 [Patescibacteria group bacterium]|nr:hypothetical protein [Patescibacteria group bacterium]MDD4611034.1 hypothetical protein [Patescibacteria group bacterium]
MKKLISKIFVVVFCFIMFFNIVPVLAQDKINLYFFYGDGCPHCAKEEKFLARLEKENQNIIINRYEIWHSRENAGVLSSLAKELKLNVTGVPVLIVGDQTINGYLSDETTGAKIRSIIDEYTQKGCTDIVKPIINLDEKESQCTHGCDKNNIECLHDCGCEADTTKNSSTTPETISVPIIGEIDLKTVSLPALTAIIGTLDGFNPCAMWTLLFLISLLLGMESRKRMWTLGAAFIISSGFVYFLFLSAWLNFFLFIGFTFWIRMIIGLVAVGSGIYHLKEFAKNRKGTCPVTEDEKRREVFYKIKNIVKKESFWLALGGIIILGFVVNLVELVCSAGFPAVYTQVLSMAHLPWWQYYGYLLAYIFFYMLDDIIIFILAMSTLRMKAISSKYGRYSNVVGGIIILIIGILLIFKPEWIMFG